MLLQAPHLFNHFWIQQLAKVQVLNLLHILRNNVKPVHKIFSRKQMSLCTALIWQIHFICRMLLKKLKAHQCSYHFLQN